MVRKVIVAGPRDLPREQEELVRRVLDRVLLKYKDCIEVIEGGASGVDWIAKEWAKEHEVQCKEFPADWNQYGKSAGPIRNKEMAKEGEVLIAFQYKDHPTRGTMNMISIAKKENVKVLVVEIERQNLKQRSYKSKDVER